MICENDVVQFNENHKWCGCVGIVTEAKVVGNNDVRYMIGVPVPQKGTAYIYSMDSKNEIEYVGPAILIPSD